MVALQKGYRDMQMKREKNQLILLFFLLLLTPLFTFLVINRFTHLQAELNAETSYFSLEPVEIAAGSKGWTKVEVISKESITDTQKPALAADFKGNIHLVWADGGIRYKCWNASTRSWSPMETPSLEHPGISLGPSIAVDSDGNVHLVWQDTSDYNGAGTDYDIFYKCRNATTETWSATVVVSNMSSDTSSNADIAIDALGNVHIVWSDKWNYNSSGTDYDVFYRAWNVTTGNWSRTEVVTVASAQGSFIPSLAIDFNGLVHVVWEENNGTFDHIYYKYRNTTIQMWSITEWVSTESLAHTWNPQIAVDSQGQIYVIWREGSALANSGPDMDIFYKIRNATTGIWTTTRTVSIESQVSSGEPAITIDAADNLHVTWRDFDIFYKCRNATTGNWTAWELVSQESTGIVSKPTIAVDPVGDVHIAWEDTTNYEGAGTDKDIFYKRTASRPEAPRLASIVPNPDDDGVIELN